MVSKEYFFAVPGKEGDEAIIIFAHRHIISFLDTILIGIFLGIMPPILWILFIHVFALETTGLIQSGAILLLLPYYLILASYIFIEWISFYSDMLIVTQKTLIDIEQKNIFDREISHLHLLQIEDIQSEIKGILPTLFGYGDVIIQTAGAEERTVIRKIPNPQSVSSMIMQLHKNALEEAGRSYPLEANRV